MDVSISVSADRISAVCGRAAGKSIKLSGFAEVSLPEGTLINGAVTNEGAFTDGMEKLRMAVGRGNLSHARLVIGTNQMFIKRTVAPKMPEKRLLEWVEGEFSELDAAEDPLLFDYEIVEDLGPDQGNEALIAAARTSLVAAYAERFKALQIRIDGIDMTHSALKKLMNFLPETRGGTGILLMLDGNILDATLYVKGRFRYNSRARIFAERGTADSFSEISRTVSSIIQFNASERSGETVSNVYFAGLKPGEETLISHIEGAFPVRAEALSDPSGVIETKQEGFVLSDYACAVGNLIRR